MKKSSLSILVSALVLSCGLAHATKGNNGGGNGGCGVGQQTNGCGTTPTTPTTPTTVHNGGSGGAGGQGVGIGVGIGVGGSGGSGGAGGAGGHGGNASATGGSALATGGNASSSSGVVGSGNSSSSSGVIGSGNSASNSLSGVVGSGNSSNTNSIRNDNTNTATGGAGGAAYGGNATGGNATGGTATSGATSSSGGNTLTGGTQSTTNNNGSAANVTVEGDSTVYEAQKRAPVASAWAAPLAASNGTCLGSASGGLQTVGVGVSFGKTTLDEGCDARYDAIALSQIGEAAAARARLCLKPEIAEAFARAGKPCKNAKPQTDVTKQALAEPVDPFVRSRLGLPPLAN